MDLVDGIESQALLRAAATFALALLVAQGIPRAIRSIYNWTAAALFGSLTGRRKRIAMLFAAASVLWVLVIAGLLYTPLTELAPRILPFPDGAVRYLMTLIELWLLVLLPLAVGGAEAYFSKGSRLSRASLVPRAFVHIVGIALAMVTLVPWIVWRFVVVRLRRKREEQLRIDIDEDKYDSVTDALLDTLRSADLTASPAPLPGPARAARWCLHRLGPPMLRPDAEYEARRIVGEGYSMLVFDGLIDIVAEKQLVSRVRQGLIGGLPPDGLWLTHSDGAREIERMIRSGEKFADIPRLMTEVDAPLEEWRMLSWEYMQALAAKDVSRNGRGPAPTSSQDTARVDSQD
jgi:hypothetical protein